MAGEISAESPARIGGKTSKGLESLPRGAPSGPGCFPAEEVDRVDSLASVTGVRYWRAFY